MIRYLLAALLALVPLAARAQTDQQTLVDRATLAAQEMLQGPGAADARNLMRRARGVMICPRSFKVAFFIGGQGGGCVLIGRLQSGWTGPAFYTMGSGSFGLQIGLQDSETLLIVRTDNGLRALLNSHFKFGADAGVAVATLGAGIGGATTAALRADIVTFSRARGLYVGVSLDGSVLSSDVDWDKAYYGQDLLPQQIVLQGQGNNPGDAPLRDVLARFSGG